jgi:protein-disulfide isomerase
LIGAKGDNLSRIANKDDDTNPAGVCVEELPNACNEVGKAGPSGIGEPNRTTAKQRDTCDELMTRLCADLGQETESCHLVKIETPKLAAERCETLLDHYNEIRDDLRLQEKSNQPLTPDQRALIESGTAPSFGPANAKVVLVEFSDFQCPYCALATNAIKQVRDTYGDRVRFVFRQFPLTYHINAHIAAQASLAANAQGKFWDYHDLLFENQQALELSDLEKYAEQLRLDVRSFKNAVRSETIQKAVAADLELGSEVGVTGTPSVFINGVRVRNATDFDELSKRIEGMLK